MVGVACVEADVSLGEGNMRLAMGRVLVTAVGLASLAGCLIAVDAAVPMIRFVNDSDRDARFVIEAFGSEGSLLVSAHSSYTSPLDECAGTGLRVETTDGELIGRIHEPACPDWTLTINEDGSLDYTEDES